MAENEEGEKRVNAVMKGWGGWERGRKGGRKEGKGGSGKKEERENGGRK